ncbi:aldehyde dehydrogenase family 3 member B1-like [Orycteropus afer afer]|uniref:Aldehyde dehydrogenase family 3 member B1-like n=1 Tax=Orycteropus afer afer TaxID=1230840 RepID=A0A8B7A6U3_ORYAF|nr:aldehyde dehydrogenase family 3 member B1-like [Orycteropus afer afer]
MPIHVTGSGRGLHPMKRTGALRSPLRTPHLAAVSRVDQGRCGPGSQADQGDSTGDGTKPQRMSLPHTCNTIAACLSPAAAPESSFFVLALTGVSKGDERRHRSVNNGTQVPTAGTGALQQSAFESEVSEISISQGEINLALRNLRAWMKDEKVPKNLATQLDSAFIRKEPYGLVLIIAPWNYPVNLTLVPLVGALAAGNCVVLKPSEISKRVEKVLAEVLPQYLDQGCFAVVLGGPEETGQLLENRFDYIFFTGSPRVGKIVMAAAAKHLTPVTLELGGKNPCYVDDDCDPQTVANRVVWFRYFNAGQTCVAPDYVLCSRETQERLLPAMQSAITRFYGDDPKSSPNLGRIVGERQFQRLQGLLGCGRVAIGGQSDESERYIVPPSFSNVGASGPLRCGHVVKRMLAGTSSGGFCGNDGFMHMTLATLPFGGVGASGMGRYHGKFSFDTFSHHRACLLRAPGMEKIYAIRYPPYSPRNLRVLLAAMETRGCSCTCTLL